MQGRSTAHLGWQCRSYICHQTCDGKNRGDLTLSFLEVIRRYCSTCNRSGLEFGRLLIPCRYGKSSSILASNFFHMRCSLLPSIVIKITSMFSIVEAHSTRYCIRFVPTCARRLMEQTQTHWVFHFGRTNISVFTALSEYGLNLAPHSLQLLQKAVLYGFTIFKLRQKQLQDQHTPWMYLWNTILHTEAYHRIYWQIG